MEVGSGTGLNLPHYHDGVTHLVLTEPERHMRRRLRKRRAGSAGRTSVCGSIAEALPIRSGSIDAVVSTLVLCSVHDPFRSLAEIHRVLKPEGMFVFLEHILSPESGTTRTWQARIEPVWKRLAGNCHLTRSTDRWIEQSGFELLELDRQEICGAPSIVRPCVMGAAVKTAG